VINVVTWAAEILLLQSVAQGREQDGKGCKAKDDDLHVVRIDGKLELMANDRPMDT
jgi:hypothetical protein